jgi:hypothetical protein
MTPEQLQEIEERCEKATLGPWKTVPAAVINGKPFGPLHIAIDGDGILITGSGGARSWTTDVFKKQIHDDNDRNADFVAHSRTDIPALCTALREAWKRIEEYKLDLKDAEQNARDAYTLGRLDGGEPSF